MTRRHLLRVLLSLLLLLSQQMAFSHAMSHWTGQLGGSAQAHLAGESGNEDNDGALSSAFAQDQTCEQCLAFAQIAGAVGSTARSFAPPDAASSSIISSAGAVPCRRTVCAFRSRAPPIAPLA
jgi:hypothetical protein